MGRPYGTCEERKRAVGSVHFVGLEFIPIEKKTTNHKFIIHIKQKKPIKKLIGFCMF
jgi:hypothetical protein